MGALQFLKLKMEGRTHPHPGPLPSDGRRRTCSPLRRTVARGMMKARRKTSPPPDSLFPLPSDGERVRVRAFCPFPPMPNNLADVTKISRKTERINPGRTSNIERCTSNAEAFGRRRRFLNRQFVFISALSLCDGFRRWPPRVQSFREARWCRGEFQTT